METAAAAATSHLRDRPAVHRGVGLTMPRGQTGPATQLLRTGEPGHVTDLGDQDRGEGRADPADLLDDPVATVPDESVRDHRPEQLDLPVVGVDQLEQRVNALAIDQIQRRGAQPCLSSGPEHV
jgi:hypothetical protein